LRNNNAQSAEHTTFLNTTRYDDGSKTTFRLLELLSKGL
jgi:hypothetical protein